MKHLPFSQVKERNLLYKAGCSFIGAIQIILLYINLPALAQTPFQLRLEAEKQVVVRNQQGEERVSWQSIADNTIVQPGDVIRYILRSENKSGEVKNFVLTQPIPQQTVYVLNSATGKRAKITYSIDGGKTFTANPTIEVINTDGSVEKKPAPASQYTHIRWIFEGAIAVSELEASYQVRVR